MRKASHISLNCVLLGLALTALAVLALSGDARGDAARLEVTPEATQAFSSSPMIRAPQPGGPPTRGIIPSQVVNTDFSNNWSGYAAAANLTTPIYNSVSDVRGSWIVPAVTGTTDASAGTWIGIDGFNTSSVEQIGVAEDWVSGSAAYSAWYEMYPAAPVDIQMAIHPGDSMSAEVRYSGVSQFTLSMTNNTTGQTFSTVQYATEPRSSAEWIQEAPSSDGTILPLADFDSVTFTGASATINGHTGPINDSAWQNTSIIMDARDGVREATPTPLTDGTSFRVIYGPPLTSPVTITNTGGDCSQIGSWNAAASSCTFTRDALFQSSGGIVLAGDGISLEGAGHAILGDCTTAAPGVQASGRAGVSVSNLQVQFFQDGIHLDSESGGALAGNTLENDSGNGISVNSSSSIGITGNTSSYNGNAGIYDHMGSSDTLIGNTAQKDAADAVYIDTGTNMELTSNILGQGPTIALVNNSSGTTIRGNRMSSAVTNSLELSGSTGSSVYNNVFNQNAMQVSVTGGSGNVFDDGSGIGNYWGNYNTPAQGCHDGDANGICDTALVFSGGQDGYPLTLPYEPSSYNWAWYDNKNGYNWVLLGNQPSAAADAWFDLFIAGSQQALPALSGNVSGQVPPGSVIAPMFGPILGGPVMADSRAGGSAITSQRSLWPKGGSSLEEVTGTYGFDLSNIFLWPWYDQQTAGMTDWILVLNPNNYQIYYEITISGELRSSGTVAAGGNAAPNFAGLIGGPVIVQAWTDATKSEPARVIASQRVLSGGGAAFNEVPGIAAGALSSDYLWTWYDMKSAGTADWVLVANPPAAAQPVYYTITIGGTQMVKDGGPLAPGQYAVPTFPGIIGGPVEVKTYTDRLHPDTTPANSIATQRSLWGPSFEEVPGRPAASLVSSDNWTWYDQSTPGMTNWVLMANLSASQIYYEVQIGGSTVDSGNIAASGIIEHTYVGKIGGPVRVQTWTDSSKTAPANSLTSQRVLYNGYFNEVWGQ